MGRREMLAGRHTFVVTEKKVSQNVLLRASHRYCVLPSHFTEYRFRLRTASVYSEHWQLHYSEWNVIKLLLPEIFGPTIVI
jgi:hypothetical protein